MFEGKNLGFKKDLVGEVGIAEEVLDCAVVGC